MSDIDVVGGAGGLSVALDDLLAAAVVLAGEAGALAAQGLRLATTLPGPEVLLEAVATAVRRSYPGVLFHPPDPTDVARVLAALARADALAAEALGPDGACGQAALLAALAGALHRTVGAYRAGEAAVGALVSTVEDLGMGAVAQALPLVAVGGGVVAVAAVVDPGVGERLDALAFDHPWLVDIVGGGVEGLVDGVVVRLPITGWVLAWACAMDGRPFPPHDDTEAVGVLEAVAALAGGLDERGTALVVRPVATSPRAVVPTSLTGLVQGQQSLGADGPEGRVRVIEVPQVDGGSAWVVEIPGTQDWRPRPGADPFDLTTDVAAMAGDATLAARGVAGALDAAMAASGRLGSADPVMLTGHSQGGILAAALASDPGFRSGHRVTQVVTAGSPVARFPVPRDVGVLSLEHAQDPVPRLDGSPNPDRASWTTVVRDLGGDADVAGRASRAHAAAEYVETARALDRVPAGSRASVDAWRADAAPFLAGDAHGEVVVRDYLVARGARVADGGWQNPRS